MSVSLIVALLGLSSPLRVVSLSLLRFLSHSYSVKRRSPTAFYTGEEEIQTWDENLCESRLLELAQRVDESH